MPHYRDGTEAKVGDLVRGQGYNVKGDDGKPATLVGTLISVTPGADSCNVVVAYAEVHDLGADFAMPPCQDFDQKGVIHHGQDGHTRSVIPRIDYGQADHFDKVG